MGAFELLDHPEQALQLQGVGEGVGEAMLHVEVAYAKEVHLDGLGLEGGGKKVSSEAGRRLPSGARQW